MCLTLLLLSKFYLSSQSLVQPLRVYIDGAEGNDSLECLSSSSIETPCQSLSFVSKNLTQKHFVAIEILGDVLNLTRAVNFTDYSNLTISGSGSSTTLHCNESDAGLAFVRVVNLSIFSLTVQNCGAPRPSTTHPRYLPIAVYVLNSSNVSLSSVDIVSSNGTGLSMYDTNGEVSIAYCNFVNNSVANTSESGGGGLYIEFTICTPGFNGDSCNGHNDHNKYSNYSINHCNFTSNSASSPEQAHKFILPSQQVFVPRLGKGGGLYISIGSNAADNVFRVNFCIFKNNQAVNNGGGMIAEFLNLVKRNSVIVSDTDFIDNVCMQTQFSDAGGLTVGFIFYITEGEHPQNNSFECHYCSFKTNRAHMGGGTTICATKDTCRSSLSSILFSNCDWIENESAMGAAVLITPAIWDYTEEGYLPVPRFRDCRFESNSAIQKLEPPMAEGIGVEVKSVGYGALFISEFHVTFEGCSVFIDNRGSAIHFSDSVIEFTPESVVTFNNNTSHNGGAIAMYSSSMIKFGNGSFFSFSNNSADTRGGAIYSEFHAATHPAYRNCFISSDESFPVNSEFVFTGNYARSGGNSIFTTTFQSCALLCKLIVELSPADIMLCIANFTFIDSMDTNLSLSSRPEKFELKETSPVMLIPGMEYILDLSAYDEAGNSKMRDIVYAASATSQNVRVDPAFQQVSNNTVMVLGENGSTAELKLFTADVLVLINITLTECQPGYHYNHSSLKCECASSEYVGLEGCNPKVYLRHSYWVGFCSEKRSELCTAYCPYGFCSYSRIDPGAHVHALENDSHLLDSDICGPSRTNRLCGECSPGRSVYHNSFKRTCGSENLCHFGWLFYILSDLLPLTLLFTVVLVFNISFTTGNANCFVLYCQLLGFLALNDSVQFSFAAKLIQNIVTFPYNSFNLNFFTLESLSFCLWKGATFMDAMMMNYLTVGCALALVLMTIFITRYRCVHTKIFMFHHRKSILIHGMSAFFILCYSQAARTTFHILNPSCLYSANFTCRVKVVHLAGHLTYFEGEHIPYAIAAILVFLFMIVIPPLLLVSYPLVFKLFGHCNLSETKLATILWRMMPIQFLDAFQSSFKDKYRFFAGLYFLYRAAILAMFVFSQTWLEFCSAVQLLLIAIITVHSVIQPHKERKHNIVDSLLFANLSLINAITLYYYASTEVLGRFKSNEVLINVLAILQDVLIILPLLLGTTLLVVEWRVSRKKGKDYEELPSLHIDR